MDLRIVFMGSPGFAVPILSSLAGLFKVIGVVTQPDRPAGRGRQINSPPVKVEATRLGLPVIQPEKIRQPDAVEGIAAWSPDLIVVAAYGQIIRQNVLDLPRLGCINVHASMLPRWRGASPIQAAILHGDRTTGVTIMKIDVGLDTGDIITQEPLAIVETETAGSLEKKLAALGAQTLIQIIPGYASGEIQLRKQETSNASYAPLIKKEDALLDFNQDVESLERKVRAYNPWPGAYFFLEESLIKIKTAKAIKMASQKAGSHTIIEGQPAINAQGGCLLVSELQPANKRVMTGREFLQGARNWIVSE
jgi:methionyl-tRNA formyltransferase